MADQVFRWVKSPHHRVFSSTSQAVQTSDLGGGQRVVIRFANLWADIEKESFPAEKIDTGLIVRGQSTFLTSDFYKIEEAVVEMTPVIAGALIGALLAQVVNWPEDAKAKVKTAIEKFGK